MLKVNTYIVVAFCVLSALSGLLLLNRPAMAQDVVAEWNSVKTPPAPEVKEVTVDPKTTALLLLDFNKQTCNAERRPRCIASIPKMKKLLDYARSKGVFVVYSLSAGAAPGDIAPDLAPMEGDPIVTSGPDKFMGTDLEKILKDKGIKTMIVTGTAAHGAVLYTASGAALRGMQVIVPVDGISAEKVYAEQYVAWNLVNAPRVSAMVTLTRAEKIK
ncbi:MAG: isochorismatase hydrolase protein [Deltaproteobacteria bacterium]|nr:isochorismatase hydrolase protein [Deltaproteobacteria bacterium]